MTTNTYQPLQHAHQHERFSKPKLFLALFLAGLLGTLTLWQLSLPADIDLPLSATMVKLISMAQVTLLLAIALWIGLVTAPKVGLAAPFFQALVRGENTWRALAPQIIPGLIGGVAAALAILLYGTLQPWITPELLNAEAQSDVPFLMRILYGGITEELLLRWGLMSLFVWSGWRLVQRGQNTPGAHWYWLGITLAALLFGIGHVPAAIGFGMLITPLRIGFVILFNTLAGLIFGWLYWRKGLEAAMIAHATAHIIAIAIFLPYLATGS